MKSINPFARKFPGNAEAAGINGFEAIIRLGNSDERLGLDKIIADQKPRLDGPPASAGSRHDGIRGLELLDCSPAWRCGSCCRRRWPPSSWITIWDRRNRPPEREGEGLGLLGMKSRAREREIPGTNSSWAGYSCRRRNLGRGAPGVLCGFGLACRVGSSSPLFSAFVIVFLSD